MYRNALLLGRTYFETHSFVELSRPRNKTKIFRKVKKYLDHGTSLCVQKNPGRSQENIDLVQEALEENPATIISRVNGFNLL